MSNYTPLKALVFSCILMANHTYAEEKTYLHAIPIAITDFHQKADAIRILTHTSKFSILPVTHHNAAFIQAPQVQGGDAVSSLIGALIAVSIINTQQSKESENAAKFNSDLNNIMQTIDISHEFNIALQKRLQLLLQQTKLEAESTASRNSLTQAGLLVTIKENYILTFENRLYFDSKMQSLCFETSPRLWLKDKANPFYLTEIKYISNPISSDNQALLKANWTQNDGERIKQAIRDGLNNTIEIFINDFLDPTWKTGPESPFREVSMSDTITGKNSIQRLYVLSETSDRIVGRISAYDAAQLISSPIYPMAH